jgi:hypothetical protein
LALLRFFIHRAFQWARAQGTPMHGDYPAARTQITREPAPDGMEPLVLARIDREAVRADAAALAQSAEILQEKELRTWFLSAEEARPYLEDVSGAQESPLVLSQVQQDDRVRRVLEGLERSLQRCARRELRPPSLRDGLLLRGDQS